MQYFLVLTVAVITGCSGLSKDQCEARDWYELGRQDGSKGKPYVELKGHVESCREMGIEIDQKTYRAGREEGLGFYCAKENAIRVGRQDLKFEDVCPEGLKKTFNRYRKIGGNLRQLDLQRDEFAEKNESLFSQLAKAKPGTDKKAGIEAEIKKNERAVRRVEKEIKRVEKKYGLSKL